MSPNTAQWHVSSPLPLCRGSIETFGAPAAKGCWDSVSCDNYCPSFHAMFALTAHHSIRYLLLLSIISYDICFYCPSFHAIFAFTAHHSIRYLLLLSIIPCDICFNCPSFHPIFAITAHHFIRYLLNQLMPSVLNTGCLAKILILN